MDDTKNIKLVDRTLRPFEELRVRNDYLPLKPGDIIDGTTDTYEVKRRVIYHDAHVTETYMCDQFRGVL